MIFSKGAAAGRTSSSRIPAEPGSIQGQSTRINPPTFDGTIDSNGHSYTGDYQAVDPSDPGYGGLWTFDNFNSGARRRGHIDSRGGLRHLAEHGHIAVRRALVRNAVYTVYDLTADITLGTTSPPINQADPPGNDSPAA